MKQQAALTPLQVFAVSLHELFLAFREAGFTESQAMFLTAQRMNADARR
jgi:hypothetical protein